MKPIERIRTSHAEPNSWAMNGAIQPAHMVTMVAEADAAVMDRIRSRARAAGQVVPSYTALVIRAAALTMARNPHANRAILGWPLFKRLYQLRCTDVSVAVEKSLPGMPGHPYAEPIPEAASRPLAQITADLQALAQCDEESNERYRLYMRLLRWLPHPLGAWITRVPECVPKLWARHRGSACWVNAPSRSGADLVTTAWPWPITFSFGVVRKRPVVVDDRIEARLTMPVVMVFDRRIMGGGPAGRVFADFKALLEDEAALCDGVPTVATAASAERPAPAASRPAASATRAAASRSPALEPAGCQAPRAPAAVERIRA